LEWKFHLGEVIGAQTTSYDDSSWKDLDVPHDYSISQSFDRYSPSGSGGGYLNGGVGWYRKSFGMPAAASPEQRVFVQFDGVYMDSTVWMNGTEIRKRERTN